MKPTWILFADASNARLYQSQAPAHDLSLLRELSHPESRAKEMDLVSDQPGRVRQSRSSARPAGCAACSLRWRRRLLLTAP